MPGKRRRTTSGFFVPPSDGEESVVDESDEESIAAEVTDGAGVEEGSGIGQGYVAFITALDDLQDLGLTAQYLPGEREARVIVTCEDSDEDCRAFLRGVRGHFTGMSEGLPEGVTELELTLRGWDDVQYQAMATVLGDYIQEHSPVGSPRPPLPGEH